MPSELESSRRLRCLLFVTGVILPLLGIVATYFGLKGSIGPLFQGGSWAYAAVLLSWPCLMVMSGLIGYCVVCLGSVVCVPRARAYSIARFGTYTGVALSGVYLVIATVAAGIAPWIAAAFAGIILVFFFYIAGEVARYWRRFSILQLIVLMTLLCVLAATVSYLDWQGGTQRLLGLALMLTLAGTPTLTFLSYLITAVYVWRDNYVPTSSVPTRVALWFAIVAVWSESWRSSIDIMLVEYSMLPTNPNCYVCSAAARGHARFVRAERCSDGTSVNMQMRRCKFLEICLAACLPRVHQKVRKLYDATGPRLAACCGRSVWLADFSYVALKPFEWLGELLRIAFGYSSKRLLRLYRCE